MQLRNKADMFSKACEYGIRACIYIAGKSMENERTFLNDIAAEIDSPAAFTSKILQTLSKAGIITSLRGQRGGFMMNPAQIEDKNVADIVKAIDGDSIFTSCGLGLKHCSPTQPCPVHDKFNDIRFNLKQVLDNTKIKELALGLKDGQTYLKRPADILP